MDNGVSRYVNLARKIKLKSEAGQINWLPASFVSTYEALMGDDGLVAIQKMPSRGEGRASYSLAFKNGLGQTFYTLRDSEVKSVPDLNSVLEGIFRSAEGMQSRGNGGRWLSSIESYVDTL